MDFDYNPFGHLDGFCSASFDDKLKRTLQSEIENKEHDVSIESLDLLIKKSTKPKIPPRRSLQSTTQLKKNTSTNINITDNSIDENKTTKKTKRRSKISKENKVEKNIDTALDSTTQLKQAEIININSNSIDENKTTKKTKRRSKTSKKNEMENDIETYCPPDFDLSSSKSQRGRARRNYMASLGANLPIQDVIDLESIIQENNNATSNSIAPKSSSNNKRKDKNTNRRSVRPPNLIVIGSDSEEDADYEQINFKNDISSINNINFKDDDDNPEIQILIEWHNQIEKLKIRKYQKFFSIIDHFAEKENVNKKEILLNLEDKIITENDTIANINYKFGDIITGRIVKNCHSLVSDINKSPNKINKDQICLKIQSNFWKNSIDMYIKKSDTFKILYIKCSETFNLNSSDFHLIFDGDQLLPNETPKNLDMEGGEIIDCVIKNKSS